MELEVRQVGNRVAFEISGIIDKQGAELLGNSFGSLNIPELKELVLDFSKVKYIGSSGVKKLLFLYKKMKTTGGKFTIENDTGIFNELLTITKMNALIDCYAN